MYIGGDHYTLTPGIVAGALHCGAILHFNEMTCKEWIKEYASEAEI